MNNEQFGQGYKSLTINFSNTKPNQHSNISGTYIDFRGKIHGSKSSSIIIEGGDDQGAYALNDRGSSGFYMTQNQRKTLMDILKGFASTSDQGSITSNNKELQDLCNAIYSNYSG